MNKTTVRLDPKKPVWVYRNLRHGRRSRPLYSVMQNGRVVARRHRILLIDAKFVVRKSGRQRVLKTGRKNVHAFVVGKVAGSAVGIDRNGKDLPTHVSYNPYDGPAFAANLRSLRDFTPFSKRAVIGARAVLLNERGMSAVMIY